jgi:glycosyltransferase involved in cell wall biosynthesis
VGAGEAWQQSRWSPPDSSFAVLFYAKFSPLHGIAAILDAVERLKEENIHFTIVGGGQLEETVRDAVARLPSTTFEWIPWLDRDGLIDRMRRCHVNLGIFGNTRKASMVIPNKVFQAIAMGVPVITRDSPAVRELLEDGKSAVLCGTGGTALAHAILACREDFDRLKSVGARGREVFAERASHRAIAKQFFEAVQAG